MPLKKGRAATRTHDYNRHGTKTLFAALDVKTGLAIGKYQPRQRANEFIRFLKRIDRCVEKHLAIHLVVDNYRTRKTPTVTAWLATPPQRSWDRQHARLFSVLLDRALLQGPRPATCGR